MSIFERNAIRESNVSLQSWTLSVDMSILIVVDKASCWMVVLHTKFSMVCIPVLVSVVVFFWEDPK